MPDAPPTSRPVVRRWRALDAARGIALWAMLFHHFALWTGGQVRGRIPGFEGFAVTDLAAPVFAVTAGAAALLAPRPTRSLWRWAQVLAIGLAIDLSTDVEVDGGGVLPTLAIVGVTIVGLRAALGHRPLAWWGVAVVSALAAGPVLRLDVGGVVGETLTGRFAVLTYLSFAAVGAALATAADERAMPVVRAGLAAVLGALAIGAWPPARYPSDLGFILWGIAGTMIVLAVARLLTATDTFLTSWAVRAGRRTLLIFGAHYVVRWALGELDVLGKLTGPRWSDVAIAAAILICVLSGVPRRRERPATSPRGAPALAAQASAAR